MPILRVDRLTTELVARFLVEFRKLLIPALHIRITIMLFQVPSQLFQLIRDDVFVCTE
jgi:hypothetical protein